MKDHLDEVEKDQDVLILSGPKKKEYVLLTLELYNAMEETAHLLSNPTNTALLMESIAQDRAGQIAHQIEVAPTEVAAVKKHVPKKASLAPVYQGSYAKKTGVKPRSKRGDVATSKRTRLKSGKRRAKAK